MYYGRRSYSGPVGRTSRQQITKLFNAMNDNAKLAVSQFGATLDSDQETKDNVLRFVQIAVKKMALEEIARLKAKPRQSYQDDLNIEAFTKTANRFLSESIAEHIEGILKSNNSPDNPNRRSLEEWTEALEGKWKPYAVLAEPPLITITPREAEIHCCQLMLYLGAKGSTITEYSQDGGVDVNSDDFVAQVKHQAAPVGVKVVRETLGVAAHLKKAAIVFAKSGFTNEAITFATQNNVLLFQYSNGIESWTVLSNHAVKNGLIFSLSNHDSFNEQADIERAISWKKTYGALDRYED